MSIEFIKPNADGSDLKIGIVSARFNDWACDAMFASCYEELKAHGVEDKNIVVTTVPGALEIPGALVMLYAKLHPLRSSSSRRQRSQR